MASPSTRTLYKSLPNHLFTALKDFQTSSSTFRVLQTVHPSTLTPTQPSPSPTSSTPSPSTLLILDSSFNPPTRAHSTLIQTALLSASHPYRLLLLFSTLNADKAPSAALFHQRLTLMTLFAVDLLDHLSQENPTRTLPQVDIAVTTAPYYTDKSAAIASSQEGKESYPGSPRHVHLLGFDTLTRFLAPKYYASFSPPLSALAPFFDAGHGLRVTMRPDEKYGDEDEQKAFLANLAEGRLEDEGGKREWAEQVELVAPNERAGVSSTVVRRAAKRGEWSVVEELCTGRVAEWVRGEGLYEEDDRGVKMG